MSAPSLIWMPGSHDAHALHREMIRIFGASLVGLWIGEDMIVDGSNNATSWPGRVGGTAVPYSAGVYRSLSVVNGRRGSTAADTAAVRGLLTSAIAAQSMIAVATTPTLPFDDYNAAFSFLSSGTLRVIGQDSTSSLYTAGGLVTTVDGATTATVTPGMHVLTADAVSSASSTYTIGNGTGLAIRNWLSFMGLAALLSATPTAGQRGQATAALKAYYSIP